MERAHAVLATLFDISCTCFSFTRSCTCRLCYIWCNSVCSYIIFLCLVRVFLLVFILYIHVVTRLAPWNFWEMKLLGLQFYQHWFQSFYVPVIDESWGYKWCFISFHLYFDVQFVCLFWRQPILFHTKSHQIFFFFCVWLSKLVSYQ